MYRIQFVSIPLSYFFVFNYRIFKNVAKDVEYLTKRPWALPIFTVLGHSKKYNETKGKKHKTAVDLAGQIVMVITRWLRILFVFVDI